MYGHRSPGHYTDHPRRASRGFDCGRAGVPPPDTRERSRSRHEAADPDQGPPANPASERTARHPAVATDRHPAAASPADAGASARDQATNHHPRSGLDVVAARGSAPAARRAPVAPHPAAHPRPRPRPRPRIAAIDEVIGPLSRTYSARSRSGRILGSAPWLGRGADNDGRRSQRGARR